MYLCPWPIYESDYILNLLNKIIKLVRDFSVYGTFLVIQLWLHTRTDISCLRSRGTLAPIYNRLPVPH